MCGRGDSLLTGFSDQAENQRFLMVAIRQKRRIRTKAELNPHIAPVTWREPSFYER